VLTVSNPGTAAVGELALVMPVPAGTSFLSAGDGGGAADEVVSWSLAGLNRGEVVQRRMTPRGWQPARIPLWDCLPSGCAHHATGAVGRLESEGVIRMRGTAVQPHLKEFDTLT
jgi:hypothetical protein